MTGAQKRYLRSLAHELRPLVQIGKGGVTDGVLKQIEDNLVAHELVKVNLRKIYGAERKEMGMSLALSTRSELVQVVGCMAILFRQQPDKGKRKITLPK